MVCVLGLAGAFATAQNPAQPNASGPVGQSASSSPAPLGQTQSRKKPRKKKPIEKAPVAPAIAAEPPTPAASPAQVTLTDGLLTIKADNSDLGQILAAVSSAGGTKLDGQVSAQRVYGVYGPGVPSAVLSNLLADTGVNVLMVGVNGQGAPDKLVLMPRVGGVTPPSTATVAQEPQQTYEPVIPQTEQEGEPLGPGAIANAPPEPPADEKTRTQLNLQRLQQMQDQQSQQEPPKD